MNRLLLLTLLASALAVPARAAEIHPLDVTGLSHPESIVVDDKTGNYYISNVNGDPLAEDGNGYITKVNADGLVVVLKFIVGEQPGESGDAVPRANQLNAPKGMVLAGGLLYVADLNAVRIYDPESGQKKGFIDLLNFNPEFLNDLTNDGQGNIYASDMTGNKIYKIKTGKQNVSSIFKRGDELGQPNGLYYNKHKKTLLAATWESGQIIEIDADGGIEVLKDGLIHLDGLFLDRRGNLFVSSFTGGEIYQITRSGRGKLTLFQSGLKTPADISYNAKSNEILIPHMMENRVSAQSLSD